MKSINSIKDLPLICEWKEGVRKCSYFLDNKASSFVIYMIYKNSDRSPSLGSPEDISCITFFEIDCEFHLCSKKRGSRALITAIGKTRERAVQNIVRTILCETNAKKFCPKEKLEELIIILTKTLETA